MLFILNIMDRVERIKEMEQHLDNAEDAVKTMIEALEKFICAQENIKILSKYFTSPLWLEDFEADENGMLPANLKRGVLSQDSIYNILYENGGIIEAMKNLIVSNQLSY